VLPRLVLAVLLAVGFSAVGAVSMAFADDPPPPPPTGAISGTVTAGDGGALSGITVSIAGSSAPIGGDGSYLVSGLADGDYPVVVSGNASYNGSSASVHVTAPDTTVKNFQLTAIPPPPPPPPPTGAISGTVTAGDGGALSGITVSIAGSPVSIGGDGSYLVSGLATGDYPVVVSGNASYNGSSASVHVTAPGTSVKNFQLTAIPPPVSGPPATVTNPVTSSTSHTAKKHVTVSASLAVLAVTAAAATDSIDTSELAGNGTVTKSNVSAPEVLPAVPGFIHALPVGFDNPRLAGLLAIVFLVLILGGVGSTVWKLRW
jgi:hypothetical protein